MIVFHGSVVDETGRSLECIGVRYTGQELAESDFRKIGGLAWRVGGVIDQVTSTCGTNPPMPNEKGWFVRPVVPGTPAAIIDRVLGSFPCVRELHKPIDIAALDATAGTPPKYPQDGQQYSRDYLGPGRALFCTPHIESDVAA